MDPVQFRFDLAQSLVHLCFEAVEAQIDLRFEPIKALVHLCFEPIESLVDLFEAPIYFREPVVDPPV